jgi:dTDP-4-amino-4,6-dideoxygalactose transaminase
MDSKSDELSICSFDRISNRCPGAGSHFVPVFVDIDKNCQLCLSEVEKAISPRTKAVVAVHYAGQCCEVDTLADICNRHGIFLIEDAAQAFLSTYKGRYLGTFGDFGCFSFHYTKNTICGEGGALLINQEIFVKRAHVVQEQGTNRFDFINNRVSKYEWVDIGSSYVSNELSATFLVAQLQDAWYCSRRRRCVVRLYQLFLEPLLDNGHIKRMIREIKNVSCNGHLFWFVLHEKDLPGFQNFMESKGIVCYSHYEPLHVSPAGLKYSKTASICMENTVQTAKNLLRLPVWVGMTHIDVFRVLSSVLEYFSDFEISLASVKEEFDRKMRDEHSGR